MGKQKTRVERHPKSPEKWHVGERKTTTREKARNVKRGKKS